MSGKGHLEVKVSMSVTGNNKHDMEFGQLKKEERRKKCLKSLVQKSEMSLEVGKYSRFSAVRE